MSAQNPALESANTTIRKITICDHLFKLNGVLEPETLYTLRMCAKRNCYADLYHRLLRLWDVSRFADNSDLINVIILAGKSAGRTPAEIAEDMQ